MTEIREYQTFQFLEGLEMSESKITLPHFTLLQYSDWKQHVIDNSNENQRELFSSITKHLNDSTIVLNVKVKSDKYQLAYEKARVLSEKFEYLMHFIIGDLNFMYSVGTKNIRKHQISTVITFDNFGLGVGSKTDVFHKNYNLKSEIVLSEKLGYDKLWNLIGNDNLSPLNKRIVTAIEWIGKALWERDYTKSFFQIMIAFEVLLQQQSNSLISSSIANQISEWGAFIYSEERDSRIEIYKKIKQLYSLRSKIVHSGFDEINADNLYDALSIIKTIITNLVTKEEFRDISLDTLHNKINLKKFS